MAGEMHVGRTQSRAELMQRGKVLLEAAVRPYQQQTRSRIEVTLVRMEVTDDVLDAFVRNDPADEQNVRPAVVELPGDEVVRLTIEVREVGHYGQNARRVEAERGKFLPVELRVAKR